MCDVEIFFPLLNSNDFNPLPSNLWVSTTMGERPFENIAVILQFSLFPPVFY